MPVWCLSVSCSSSGCECSFFCEITVKHSASVLIRALHGGLDLAHCSVHLFILLMTSTSCFCIGEHYLPECAIYLYGGPPVISFSAQWSTLKLLKCPLGGSDFSAEMSCAPIRQQKFHIFQSYLFVPFIYLDNLQIIKR